jgi:predicted MFS family arabinose efflux permease
MQLLRLYRDAFSGLHRNTWMLAVSMFVNRSGSMVLLFSSLYMTKELHFSVSQTGLIMSLYGIGSVLGAYAGGWLTDRMNYFSLMLWSLVGCGLILLLMLVATTPLTVGLVIFFYPLVGDMFRPANSTAITAYSTPENRTRSVSLVRLAVNLGFSVGPAVGGFIALYLGYKWLYVLDALTSFCAAALLRIYLPKQPPGAVVRTAETKRPASPSAYRDFRYLFFSLLVATYGICFFQLFASVPQYFSREFHYSEDTIGLLLALNGFLVVVIELPLVLVLEKHRRNFRYIILGTLCLPVAFGILLLHEEAIVFSIVYTFFITLSEIFAMPFMMNHALSRGPSDRQGQYAALYSIAFGAATIGAPSIGLVVAEKFGFASLFYLLIAVSLLLSLLFHLIRERPGEAAG